MRCEGEDMNSRDSTRDRAVGCVVFGEHLDYSTGVLEVGETRERSSY